MRRRQSRKKKKPSGAPKWMVTYSDMVTLILVFFILLFSMSQVDVVKFEAISESFRNRMIFDFLPSPVPMEHPSESSKHIESGESSDEVDLPKSDKDSEGEEEAEKDTLEELMTDIDIFLDEHGLHDVITANRTERGVVLVLQESILFNSAEAEILDKGKPFLSEVGSLLIELPNQVKVEGHTDNRPISNYRYPSNWELSGARASSVIRYLIEKYDFDDTRFSAVGYADTRPAVPNTNTKNWSINRRVEIVILDENATEDTEEGNDEER